MFTRYTGFECAGTCPHCHIGRNIIFYFICCILPFKRSLLSSLTGSARGVPVAIPADLIRQTEVSSRLCFGTAFQNYCHYCSVAVSERGIRLHEISWGIHFEGFLVITGGISCPRPPHLAVECFSLLGDCSVAGLSCDQRGDGILSE